jgi:hypothetical protein
MMADPAMRSVSAAFPAPVRAWPCTAVPRWMADGRNLAHRPAATCRAADSGRLDISAAVIRSFERLGWATKVRRPAPSHLDSCRRHSRQPGGLR